jgi:hypothetical protein
MSAEFPLRCCLPSVTTGSVLSISTGVLISSTRRANYGASTAHPKPPPERNSAIGKHVRIKQQRLLEHVAAGSSASRSRPQPEIWRIDQLLAVAQGRPHHPLRICDSGAFPDPYFNENVQATRQLRVNCSCR